MHTWYHKIFFDPPIYIERSYLPTFLLSTWVRSGFVSLGASYNWNLHQVDINTTFLHGDLDKEINMKVSTGLKVADKNIFVNKIDLSIAWDKLAANGTTSVWKL